MFFGSVILGLFARPFSGGEDTIENLAFEGAVDGCRREAFDLFDVLDVGNHHAVIAIADFGDI